MAVYESTSQGVRQRQHLPVLAAMVLVLMCAIWGSTFPLLKGLTEHLSALEMTLLRYGGAGLLLLPGLRGVRTAEWRWGLILGAVLFAAFYLQTEGIARTSANRNAFITGLNVLAVPIFAVVLGQRLNGRLLWACGLAGLGMYGLFYAQAPWNAGDSYTAVAMLCYAVYILLLEVSARRHAAQPLRLLPLTALQGLVMGLCACFLLGAKGELAWLLPHVQRLNGGQIATLLYLLLFASALAPAMQIWAQRYVPAVQSALIYGLEPVFAAVFAYAWLGEQLQGWALLGAMLVVAAMLLGQWPVKPKQARQKKAPENSGAIKPV